MNSKDAPPHPAVQIITHSEGGIHPVTGEAVNPNDPGFIKDINQRKIQYLIKELGQEENLQRFKIYHKEWEKYIKTKIPLTENIRDAILNHSEISQFTAKIKNEIINNPSFPKKSITTFLNLFSITESKTDSLLFEHLIEVSLLSAMVGIREYSSDDDINSFMLGGLLHDIGMLKIPAYIIHKNGMLTDEEKKIIQKHPLFSAMIIKSCFKDDSELNRKIFAITLQHHWNNRGNGYFRQDYYEIKVPYLPHSRIVSICDTYSALIEKRAYRNALAPFDAIQEMERMRNKNLYDGHAFNLFINEVGRIPNSTYVKVIDTKLADMNIKEMIPGIVVEQNEGFPNTPNVKLLDGSNKILTCNELSTRYKIAAIYHRGKFIRS